MKPILSRPRSVHLGSLIAVGALLGGCSVLSQGELPTDVVIARLHWHRDQPGFRMQDLDWRQVEGADAASRLANLCGIDARWTGRACAFRVPQGGICLVYSLYSQEQARVARDASGESVETHELRHCGVNLPSHGGWAHRETVVLR